jgi:hypothetical protein
VVPAHAFPFPNVAQALAIHTLAIHTLAIHTLALRALVVLAGTVFDLMSLRLLGIATGTIFLLAPLSLLEFGLRPRGERGSKSKQKSSSCDPNSHGFLLGCVLYGRTWSWFNSILSAWAAPVRAMRQARRLSPRSGRLGLVWETVSSRRLGRRHLAAKNRAWMALRACAEHRS